MKLVLLALCLTPLASAAFVTLYWCDTSGQFTDGMVLTQQGQNSLGIGEMILIGMDSPSEKDQLKECEARAVGMAPVENSFSLLWTTKNLDSNEGVSYIGNVTNQKNNNYMLIEPFEEDPPEQYLNFEAGVMNAGSNGKARMTITYWSETEIVLRTCHNAFFGSNHAAYVFTSQPENFAGLSSECMLETIKSLPDLHWFDIQMTPLDILNNCEAYQAKLSRNA